MKSNTIISGIWLVFIGLVVLLHNFDIIDFNFWAIIKLIPLLIIALGINLIVQNKPYGGYITIGVNVVICSVLLIKGLTTPRDSYSSQDLFSENISINDNKDEDMVQRVESIYENDEKAKLIFNGGSGNYVFEQKDSAKLFEAWSINDKMGIELNTTKKDNEQKTLIVNSKSFGKSKNRTNTTYFTLHKNPIWDLEFNIGAANFTCDLSGYKISNMNINSGAANMKLTLGEPLNGVTKIEIATAASKIYLKLPKDAACSYTQESILSSKKISGFDIQEGDVYKTSNFDEATNRYEIDLTGAANSFEVTRY
ncbi:LiaI-LiaF-like domain-containing protein [Sphingobacterium hungaricum]